MNTKILAKVNGKDITENDVNLLLENLGPQRASQFASEEGKQMLLDELITQELFYLEALEAGLDQEEAYQQELAKIKESILKQYAVKKLLTPIEVAEEEILDYYNLNKEQFETTGTLDASHILVNDEGKAEEILNEINGGLSFEDAAKKYSSCPSKSKGGNLGPFTKGQMVKEFEQAAFNMSPGEISKPVKTQFGYHLIKVIDQKEATTLPLEEAKKEITGQLLAMKRDQAYMNKSAQLRSGKYEITTY